MFTANGPDLQTSPYIYGFVSLLAESSGLGINSTELYGFILIFILQGVKGN